MYTLNSTEVHAVCYAIDHVVTRGGNCTAQGKCWYEEVSPTLKNGGVHAVCCIGVDLYNQCLTGGVSKTLNNRATDSDHIPCVLVYESHGQDCRYKPLGEVCSTVSQTYGTGGGNAPIVVKYERD